MRVSRSRIEGREFSDSEDQPIPIKPTPIPAEFARNASIGQLKYNIDRMDKENVMIVGANPLAEELFKQLLMFGFRKISIWSSARDSKNNSLAAGIMKKWKHLSPFYRHREGFDSLESLANTASYDELGFSIYRRFSPSIMINTVNNSYLSDFLAGTFMNNHEGLFVDAHTIKDHQRKLYGMNIQTMLSASLPTFDKFKYIEERDLSLFEEMTHDPLMSVICASYVGAMVSRFALTEGITESNASFAQPNSFTLFPFTDSPNQVAQSQAKVNYRGFFGDRNLYLAGLGGGSLCLDLLVKLFDVNNLIAVDRDRLERSNFNRLTPFADEALIGKKKTEAAEIVYEKFMAKSGKRIRFIDGVISDDLLAGKDEKSIDMILGMFSGFDNKLNLVSLAQKLAKQKHNEKSTEKGNSNTEKTEKPALIDIGVEPFRVDVTPYILGKTPCDHCRNIYGQAVTDHIANNIPNCDRYPVGSTIFANYLGTALALVQAMKYFNPQLGNVASHSVTANLMPALYSSELLHQVSTATDVNSEHCFAHCTTTPLDIQESDFRIVKTMEQGWHVKDVYTKKKNDRNGPTHLGRIKYSPKA